jgi:hypothetical protein
MLVKVVHLVSVENSLWAHVITVTVLALEPYHIAVFSDVLFETFKAELVQMTTEALKTVAWTIATFNMTLQFKDRISFDFFSLTASVTNLDFIDDVL